MSSFNSLQVVRALKSVRFTKGNGSLKKGAKVVVIKQEGNTVTARFGTSKADYKRVVAPASAFEKTFRGRPKGVKNHTKNAIKGVTSHTKNVVATEAVVAAPAAE